MTLFVVPAGETWLVKRVCTQNPDLTTGTYLWFIGVAGVNVTVYSAVIAGGRADDHECWWVLKPGWSLHCLASLTADGKAIAFGAQLEGVAD